MKNRTASQAANAIFPESVSTVDIRERAPGFFVAVKLTTHRDLETTESTLGFFNPTHCAYLTKRGAMYETESSKIGFTMWESKIRAYWDETI